MSLLETIFKNHPFANITFVVVLVMGALSYSQMPREQDPEINFNFVAITTVLPGASSADIEKKVTSPLEDSLRSISDVKFVSSTSRESISHILVRFEEISDRKFDKRVVDLRREIQNKASDELPSDAEDPKIIEITTSNGFPTAMILVRGQDNDESLRYYARGAKKDIEGLKGVDSVYGVGIRVPVFNVEFDPIELANREMKVTDVSDTVAGWFRDTVAGMKTVGDDNWLVRIQGTDNDPSYLGQLPMQTSDFTNSGLVTLADVADVSRGRERPESLASYNGKPAVILNVSKKSYTNTISLVESIADYIEAKNAILKSQGIELILIDDQTIPTRTAIGVMQNNALLGLFFVMLVCWIFLGTRIALMVGFGLPFSLAATFWVLHSFGMTLNMSVLLGVVIALGMLVDDAVVVVETIYFRTQRGDTALEGAIGALKEVFQPVTASVLTTIAAFLPLMLLPGIVGKFMFVIPFVVAVALALSLIEAYWMLPSHMVWLEGKFGRIRGLDSGTEENEEHWRTRFSRTIRLKYAKALLVALRKPKQVLSGAIFLLVLAIASIGFELVRVQFFAFDTLRLFYLQVDMPAGATIEDTLATSERASVKMKKYLKEGDARAVTATAGVQFTNESPIYGDQYGQVVVSLNPKVGEMRSVPEIIAAMREDLESMPTRGKISFLQLEGGPPKASAIRLRVMGDTYEEIRLVSDRLMAIIKDLPGTKDVVDDDIQGMPQLTLNLNREAVREAGLSPAYVARIVRLFVDGEVVASVRDAGEKVEVIVKAKHGNMKDISQLMDVPVSLPHGGTTSLGNLVDYKTEIGKGVIKHYKHRLAITVEADIDKEIIDTVAVNKQLMDAWNGIKAEHSTVFLDFSGEWDDIQESLDGMLMLFLLGLGIMYLIMATQFKSYSQPIIVLVTMPLAFTGVTFGLLVTNNVLSMFTMYGMVALTGIAVNAAIVLMDATNQRFADGMSALHATVYAARRRVIPIIITTTTTIAGLFSLAAGLGGKSVMWGGMATSIVSGIAFATALSLFVVPILIYFSMRRKERLAARDGLS
ncbi:MAG: efflux RND transporter permease subunit [Pseudomonadales bacterium]|nr:efflux RND transporter permease subunit [Pseudomonadales bacterium]